MTTEASLSFQMGLHDNSESLKLKNGNSKSGDSFKSSCIWRNGERHETS